jgi:hypothetical protein
MVIQKEVHILGLLLFEATNLLANLNILVARSSKSN